MIKNTFSNWSEVFIVWSWPFAGINLSTLFHDPQQVVNQDMSATKGRTSSADAISLLCRVKQFAPVCHFLQCVNLVPLNRQVNPLTHQLQI